MLRTKSTVIEIGDPRVKRFRRIKIGDVELKSLERRVRALERRRK